MVSRTSSGSRSSNSPRSSAQQPHLLKLDRPLILALGLLVSVYSIVTLVTYAKVSDTNHEEQHDNWEASSPVKTTATTAQRSAQSNAARQQKKSSKIEQLQHMFPLHIGSDDNDTELIPHPGLAMIAPDAQKIPDGLPKTMRVPKLFDESYSKYYERPAIRDFLGDDGTRLLTPDEAAAIGSVVTVPDQRPLKEDPTRTTPLPTVQQETIYCSVASYRDPECTATVEDLYARAAFPDRIRVAILDQRVDGDSTCAEPPVPCETDPTQALCRYRHLIDVFDMDARLAVGPVFARHLAHRHYRGEYFAMQIDSHVRFVENWDTDIVEQWKSAHNEMGVLSTYLSDIIGSIDPETHAGIHKGRPIMCMSDYEGSGDLKHLRHGQQPEGAAGIHGQPTLHPFWAAGFSFARGHFVIQVPYDQHLPMVFQGEEISIGLRGFSYGYDYYAAERSVCFHMYAIKENKARRKKIPLFWENASLYKGAGVRAMKRLNTIIGMGDYPPNEWPQADRDKYGMGKVRPVEKFFETFGLHIKEQKVEQHLCQFVGKPMMRVFMPALRENHMGLDYDKIDYKFVDPKPDTKSKKEKTEKAAKK